MILHFDRLTFKSFFAHHDKNSSIAFWSFRTSDWVFMMTDSFLSSAKFIEKTPGSWTSESLKYAMKNSGPRLVLCPTPDITVIFTDVELPILMRCVHAQSYDESHFISLLKKRILDSLASNFLGLTESNALLMSA